VGTTTNTGPLGITLATRHVGYWGSKAVPGYLAYRMGGRFYVRGFDDEDFAPFSRIAGGTTEFRAPLWRTESGEPGGITLFGFLDYALGNGHAAYDLGSWRSYRSGGLGISLGPVKLEYALNNRRDGKIHVSLVDPTF
jgi:outer membrane protein assembly factor BamA